MSLEAAFTGLRFALRHFKAIWILSSCFLIVMQTQTLYVSGYVVY
jgi:hypothetical protein